MNKQHDQLAAYLAKGVLDMAREIANEHKEISREISSYQNETGEVRQDTLLKGLKISKPTLKKWEENGLNRLERGGLVFYLLEELHKFNY